MNSQQPASFNLQSLTLSCLLESHQTPIFLDRLQTLSLEEINIRNESGMSLIQIAAREGLLDVVVALCFRGAKLNGGELKNTNKTLSAEVNKSALAHAKDRGHLLVANILSAFSENEAAPENVVASMFYTAILKFDSPEKIQLPKKINEKLFQGLVELAAFNKKLDWVEYLLNAYPLYQLRNQSPIRNTAYWLAIHTQDKSNKNAHAVDEKANPVVMKSPVDEKAIDTDTRIMKLISRCSHTVLLTALCHLKEEGRDNLYQKYSDLLPDTAIAIFYNAMPGYKVEMNADLFQAYLLAARGNKDFLQHLPYQTKVSLCNHALSRYHFIALSAIQSTLSKETYHYLMGAELDDSLREFELINRMVNPYDLILETNIPKYKIIQNKIIEKYMTLKGLAQYLLSKFIINGELTYEQNQLYGVLTKNDPQIFSQIIRGIHDRQPDEGLSLILSLPERQQEMLPAITTGIQFLNQVNLPSDIAHKVNVCLLHFGVQARYVKNETDKLKNLDPNFEMNSKKGSCKNLQDLPGRILLEIFQSYLYPPKPAVKSKLPLAEADISDQKDHAADQRIIAQEDKSLDRDLRMRIYRVEKFEKDPTYVFSILNSHFYLLARLGIQISNKASFQAVLTNLQSFVTDYQLLSKKTIKQIGTLKRFSNALDIALTQKKRTTQIKCRILNAKLGIVYISSFVLNVICIMNREDERDKVLQLLKSINSGVWGGSDCYTDFYQDAALPGCTSEYKITDVCLPACNKINIKDWNAGGAITTAIVTCTLSIVSLCHFWRAYFGCQIHEGFFTIATLPDEFRKQFNDILTLLPDKSITDEICAEDLQTVINDTLVSKKNDIALYQQEKMRQQSMLQIFNKKYALFFPVAPELRESKRHPGAMAASDERSLQLEIRTEVPNMNDQSGDHKDQPHPISQSDYCDQRLFTSAKTPLLPQDGDDLNEEGLNDELDQSQPQGIKRSSFCGRCTIM